MPASGFAKYGEAGSLTAVHRAIAVVNSRKPMMKTTSFRLSAKASR